MSDRGPTVINTGGGGGSGGWAVALLLAVVIIVGGFWLLGGFGTGGSGAQDVNVTIDTPAIDVPDVNVETTGD
ncbi:hypothetical protein GTW25_14085 [Aliihoeflea aestuarii]|jgi:hypothetical protein|uniref:hypothetical protein n=1 Tax=Aliihoeflea aestuarii TaxID=453840 RepID=UPI0020965058|nr:hypothetical protein [Aliihoeflea aestuarii]MCO6392159.1 hypothetical protein [Aliihoeflea aestuarii]